VRTNGLWRGGAPLVLASKSHARRKLLAAAHIPFQACDAGIDERSFEVPYRTKGIDAAGIARALAREKALATVARMPGRLVLAADQTLSIAGKVLTKPTERAAAVAQLEQLSGKVHELHSAICLARSGEILLEVVPMARLLVRPLSRAFIEAYVGLVGDAALSSVGAYRIEELGIHLFETVEGDQPTILGLPLIPLLAYLRAQGLLLA
jgi:septum formation protein